MLTWGCGADSSIFDIALCTSELDRIRDYNVAADMIRLDNAIFTGLAAGTLKTSAFAKNTSGNATDAQDRIICETDTGRLCFDKDGTGSGQSASDRYAQPVRHSCAIGNTGKPGGGGPIPGRYPPHIGGSSHHVVFLPLALRSAPL